jgi:hypothetical protein
MAKKKAKATKATKAKKATGKRELVDTGRDKRFVRRNDQGEFKESADVGRSSAKDQKTKAKKKAPRGQGDRGDR